ncbi:hypothetical protein BGZ76_011800 [Entomortierella beljakovae]|nr:hypothetical protein BGZ76_011800 [Entomortierella beljakovae]
MDDLDMDQAFDFKTLSLDDPDEQLRKTLEHSLNLDADQEPWQTSAIPHSTNEVQPYSAATVLPESEEQSPIEVPDNGPWARLPTGKEVHPFQPGVTAEKLDAMALNPNHMFKSAQTPFPYSVPTPEAGPSGSKSTNQTNPVSAKGNEKTGQNNNQNEQDKIPEWMLEDPELVEQPQWSLKDTTGPNFSSQDFALDWSSSGDLSTTIDSNVLFGFSSYPTYESLAISSTIAEEQHRRVTGSGFNNPTSPTSNDGGFAKYVSSNASGLTNSTAFGFKGLSSDSTTTDNQASGSVKPNALQWQNWRSAPSDHIDLDLDLDDFDDDPSGIKVTPGFAPAQFRRE